MFYKLEKSILNLNHVVSIYKITKSDANDNAIYQIGFKTEDNTYYKTFNGLKERDDEFFNLEVLLCK